MHKNIIMSFLFSYHQTKLFLFSLFPISISNYDLESIQKDEQL